MADSNKKMAMNRDVDRLGALPDPILHYIISLLDMKQVVETSLLSARWRNLWLSVPALNFDHSLWKKKSKCKKNNRYVKNKFMNFVDKVLSRHDGTNVTKFQISCSTFCDFDRFGGWMTIAATKQIQEFHIDQDAYKAGEFESRELPGDIFATGVTVFKFSVTSGYGNIQNLNSIAWAPKFKALNYGDIRIPNSMTWAPQLKTLVLSYVELPQGNSNGELVLSCPLLESLELYGCVRNHLKVLDIFTPQLRNLVIEMCALVECGQVNIFTPILESLRMRGEWNNNCSFGTLSSLVNVKILNFDRSSTSCSFIQFLESISCATTIELHWRLKDLNLDILDMATISFSKLKCLQLGASFTILKLFKSSPCLETLVFIEKDMKNWQEGLCSFNFDHLKSLEIGFFDCYEYELNFLEYLLENVLVLEKLKIRMGTYKENFVDKMESLVEALSSGVVLSIIRNVSKRQMLPRRGE